MKVSLVMTREFVAVGLDDSLGKIRTIFEDGHFHHLLVVNNDKLFGVISDRDLLKAISPNIGKASENTRDIATLNKRAHQILTRKPITLPPCASIHDAIAIFNERKISCIPIIDEHLHPVGILTWRDIMKTLAQRYQEKYQEQP